MDSYEEASDLIRLAKDYRTRGMHPNARDCFRRAASMLGRLNMFSLACWCWTQHDIELGYCRPAAPVNVSALVD